MSREQTITQRIRDILATIDGLTVADGVPQRVQVQQLPLAFVLCGPTRTIGRTGDTWQFARIWTIRLLTASAGLGYGKASEQDTLHYLAAVHNAFRKRTKLQLNDSGAGAVDVATITADTGIQPPTAYPEGDRASFWIVDFTLQVEYQRDTE